MPFDTTSVISDCTYRHQPSGVPICRFAVGLADDENRNRSCPDWLAGVRRILNPNFENSKFFNAQHIETRPIASTSTPGLIDVDDSNPTGPNPTGHNPTGPIGHARGIATSSRLTQLLHQQKRSQVDVTPQQVAQCLRAASNDPWVLIGLRGYADNCQRPGATWVVNVMETEEDRTVAVAAIGQRWPELKPCTRRVAGRQKATPSSLV